jgi:ArsR family metal-binding transcriptional regulator
MLKWKDCGRAHERLGEVMNQIFRNHPKLLDFVFYPDRPELRDEPDVLLQDAGCFSTGEQVLIRIALDLWTGEVEVKLWDMIQRLDQSNYQNVLLGLRILRPYDPDASDICWRQPKLAYSEWERSFSST